MLTKKSLKIQNEVLREENNRLRDDLDKLLHRPIAVDKSSDVELNMKYLLLSTKYNKLMDSCLSKETEYITYNGELYNISTIDYHKDVDSVDTLNISAVHVQREKGLINNLAEPIRNVAKQLNKIFFGTEDN